jgi:anaerobic selenocysteine-containing dehydrogenase
LRVIIDDNLFDAEFVSEWTVGFEELKILLRDYPLEKVENITWVPQDAIRKAAHLYAETRPACVFTGNALDQIAGSSQTIRAIAKTPVALHDKLPLEMNEKRLGSQFLLTRFEFTKLAHPPSAIEAILKEAPYPVKVMLAMAANPALTAPNSRKVRVALEKLDFLAVADLFMTKTAQLADVVLPTCTFLERTYYATYEAGAYLKPAFPGLLMLRPQVVPPLEESRPDWQIIFDLAKKLGYQDYFPWQNIEGAIDYELEPTGITSRDLREHPEGIQIFGPLFKPTYHKYTSMGFLTLSKKVEILSTRFQKMGYDSLPVYHEPSESPLGDPELARAFPLVLTTGAKLLCYVHSQMRNIPSLSRHMPHNVVEIHPNTAADLSIGEGDIVLVESPRGGIECRARLTDQIRPRVVQLFHGFEEANANILTDNSYYDPITGSVPVRSLLCQVRKA